MMLTREGSVRKRAAVAQPLGNQEPPTKKPLQQSGQCSSPFWHGYFGRIQWNGTRKHADSCTTNEAADDEHAHRDSTGL